MDAWSSPLSYRPQLPENCQPENNFLYRLSSISHVCIPTTLGFISTLLGTCSIISWLFAQMPQIKKNYQLKSTSGLSIFFLGVWLLGDVSNLFGSVFTRQATWQVIIASYYCLVDLMLVGQWIWYELLHHGQPLRNVWARHKKPGDGDAASFISDSFDTMSIASSSFDPSTPKDKSIAGSPRPIPPPHSGNIFNTPNFSRSPSVNDFSSANNTPTSRVIMRPNNSGSPMPSPRTVLYVSLLLAVLSSASPVQSRLQTSPFAPLYLRAIDSPALIQEAKPPSAIETAGKLLSWLSTLLYLGSRLPQIYKNHRRRSTAGLSPTLFAAAFFGNLFYSSSMLTNPCAWYDYPVGDSRAGRGWVGREGSVRYDWIVRAMPFFLGAAGVLMMDALVGFQFWWFGSHDGRAKGGDREEIVVVVVPDAEGSVRKGKNKKWRWKKVSGWMRGWVPSVTAVGTLVKRTQSSEYQGLLRSADGRAYGASQRQ